MKKTWIVAALVTLLPMMATAATRSETLKQIESSLLVRGTIQTNVDGSVDALVIDQPEKFPPGVVDFVQKQVAGWRFEPVLVDGKAMRARSPMSLRIVAKRVDDDAISISIRNANFDGEPAKEGESLSAKRMYPPRYPELVARAGASGTAYVVVRVGKDGRVSDALVEQVNLRTVGTVAQMNAWRAALSDAVLKAARTWTFVPPTRGELADDGVWSARVPADFKMDSRQSFSYGKWELYVPGPRQTIPWSEEERPGFSPDSLAEGGVYMIGESKGPKLLTTLDGT